LSMTYFHTNFSDLIQFDGTVWKMANIAKAKTTGLEACAGVNTDRVEAGLSFTVTDAIDRESDQPLLRRPQTQATLNASYHIATPLWMGLDVIYTGEREDMDYDAWPARRVLLADFAVVNLSGSYRVNRLLNLSVRINNLFDAAYEQVYRFNRVPRSAMFGLTLTL
jgi:vitamin B12 transporter